MPPLTYNIQSVTSQNTAEVMYVCYQGSLIIIVISQVSRVSKLNRQQPSLVCVIFTALFWHVLSICFHAGASHWFACNYVIVHCWSLGNSRQR